MGRNKLLEPTLKVQTTLDAVLARDIHEIAEHFRISHAEVVRAAYRLYEWACKRIQEGRDFGSFDRITGRFVIFDVPYSMPNLVPSRSDPSTEYLIGHA